MTTTITITTHPAFPRHRERLTVCEVVGSRMLAYVPKSMVGPDDNVEAFFRKLLFLRPDERVVIREVEA